MQEEQRTHNVEEENNIKDPGKYSTAEMNNTGTKKGPCGKVVGSIGVMMLKDDETECENSWL